MTTFEFRGATPSERSLRVKMDDPIEYAGMAELADALDSGSSESNFMEVQVLLPAPNKNKTNLGEKSKFVLFYLRDYFGIKIKR